MSLKFILVKEKKGYDISDLVRRVNWSGRKNSPARSLELTLMDDPSLGENNRAGIDVYSGNHLIFLEDGTELFRGIIMRQIQTQEHTLSITAYDNAIYLSNNRDSFSYKKKTITEVFLDICTKYGISRGETASVQYKIPVLTDIGVTIYDILCNGLSQTYKGTGERFYILSKRGQLHLLRRKEQITKLVLETGKGGSDYGNITQYSYSKDISATRTRLKLISQNGKVMASWSDMALEEKLGMMQDVQIPDDSISKSKLKTLVISMLNELKKPAESLDVTALGISTIYSGIAVYISIPDIGIGRTFYVDADTHTWEGDFHTMRLTLNFATDLESINDVGAVETETSADSAATAEAKKAIKDAATALKEKKKAENKVIKAGAAAERAANIADRALTTAQKASSNAEKYASNAKKVASYKAQIEKQAKTIATQAAKAKAENEKAKTALSEVKALMNLAQATITTNADFAVNQAEASVRRATEAEEQVQKLL